MCACRDGACTDRVLAELTRWVAEEGATSAPEFPEQVRREIDRNYDNLDACRRRILTTPGN
jgi:hypothetical protein